MARLVSFQIMNHYERVIMSNEFETAKTAIETADKALDLYNKVLDQLIPWKTFEETIKELTRYKDEYSQKSSTLVGEVKTLLLDCQDKYFESTQSVYEWCLFYNRYSIYF